MTEENARVFRPPNALLRPDPDGGWHRSFAEAPRSPSPVKPAMPHMAGAFAAGSASGGEERRPPGLEALRLRWGVGRGKASFVWRGVRFKEVSQLGQVGKDRRRLLLRRGADTLSTRRGNLIPGWAMLFNSFEFIFALLPVSVVLYFLASRISGWLAVSWLVLVSLFFYGWWRPENLPLFVGSILFNFGAASLLDSPQQRWPRRTILMAAIVGNLSLLATFKYSRFLVANGNHLLGTSIPLPDLVLPLGISFFTFTQIAYLVDIYKARGTRHSLSVYALFVSYYPHLLAGPILHHAEMLPQFADDQNRRPRWDHLWQGLCLFGIGLSKKVLLADALAPYARFGFDVAPQLNLLEAWFSSLAYFFQIYFDFSGYTDMAVGAALLMNIRLPFNFDSPYRSCDIQSFWRKWHITLGRFFRDYVYIPLGGNRLGGNRTLINLFGVALLSGLWHGAAWSFVAWGALHGVAMVVHALWKKRGRPLPAVAAVGADVCFPQRQLGAFPRAGYYSDDGNAAGNVRG